MASITSNELINFISYVRQGKQIPPIHPVFQMLADIKSNATRKLMIGCELYRARLINDKDEINKVQGFYGYDAMGSFVNPDTSKIGPLRANREHQPRLYCADVPYLSLIEVKPKQEENKNRISLATIRTNDVLTLLDLTLFHIEDDIMNKEKKELFRSLSLLYSTPVEQKKPEEYLPTQIIADYIEELGYDGIAYSSSISPKLNAENYTCANYVIFKYKHCTPIKSNVFKLSSLYNEESVDYDYTNFRQCDEDPAKINLISYKDDSYDFNFPFGSKASEAKVNPTGRNTNVFVSTGTEIFVMPVYILMNDKDIIIKYDSSMITTYARDGVSPSNTKFTVPDTLDSQINDLLLMISAIVNKGMYIGDRENPRRGKVFEDVEKQLPTGYLDHCKKLLCRDAILKKSLLSQNIYTNFNLGR